MNWLSFFIAANNPRYVVEMMPENAGSASLEPAYTEAKTVVCSLPASISTEKSNTIMVIPYRRFKW